VTRRAEAEQGTDWRARLNGHEIRYVEGGAAGATRVLLLFNGIGASVETAASFAAAFRDTRVIAFDAPGVGGSATPRLPWACRRSTCSACPGAVRRRRSSRCGTRSAAAR
jgi:pimeloyl-ACP methyl ester carboxylesterase